MKKTIIMLLIIILFLVLSIVNKMLNKHSYEEFFSNKVVSNQEKTKNNYNIFIDGTCHKLYLFNDNEIVKEFNIASGKINTPSPSGVWKVIKKDNWGEGFGGYWLGLNVPWGTYGIHGTTKPSSIGKDASHGCIRMYSKDAKELFSIVPCGTATYIYMGPYGPFTNGYRKLKPGDFGSDVLAVQMVLKKKGYYSYDLDGNYGKKMEVSIHKFEKDNNMHITNLIDIDIYNKLGLFPFE